MTSRKRRASIAVVAFALLIAACGGGDDEPTAESSPTTTTAGATTQAPDQQTTAAPAADPTDPPTDGPGDEPMDDPPAASGAENTAVVTVGGKTYEFKTDVDLIGRCDPDFFGAFWVSGQGVDDPSNTVGMLIIPDSAVNHSETSTITVNLKESEDHNWRADEDGGEGAEPGVSRVTSFEIDGNTVTGTAEFHDTYTFEGESAEGTFTATCPA